MLDDNMHSQTSNQQQAVWVNQMLSHHKGVDVMHIMLEGEDSATDADVILRMHC